MKKKLIAVAVIAAIMLVMCSCSAELKYIGKWNIKEINAGDGFTMDAEELEEYGIDNPGFITLNKSGSATVNLLGDEYEGTWEYNEGNESVTITYGKDNQVGTATKKDKVLTFTDSAETVYKLEK